MKNLITFCSLLVFLFSCKEKESPVIMKTLNYPSASAVEYVNGKLYVMGDDATKMIVLDTNFNVVDSIKLFDYTANRIPKDVKHDIESMMLHDDSTILLLGSGSLSPFRDSVWLVNINAKTKEGSSIELFDNLIVEMGIKEVNIEGIAGTYDDIILVNRGHLGYPENNLIITSNIFSTGSIKISKSKVNHNTNSSSFQGISGLTCSKSGALIMTASTEKTASTFEDGEIGKSYIWITNNISIAPTPSEIKSDKVIDLEEIDHVFQGQKIESVTILNETKESLRLVLVADNDNGSSTIFKLNININ
jgi:hypothetical protein